MPDPRENEPLHDASKQYDFRVDAPLRPARAIRARCLHCVGNEWGEVRNCTATEKDCHLWPYRMGAGRDGSRPFRRRSRLKTIRDECMHCMGGCVRAPGVHNPAAGLVRECDAFHCPLWPWRTGHRPRKEEKAASSRPKVPQDCANGGRAGSKPPRKKREARNATHAHRQLELV
jgi:hypothetical protein